MSSAKNTKAVSTKGKGNTKFGSQRHNKRRQIVSMRKKGSSWAAIGTELDVAPRTVRRMFDEAQGVGAHFDSRVEGKGGRRRIDA